MQTYNLGRVVGWSTYEQFIKDHPDIDPDVLTESIYQTMVSYGVSRQLVLSLDGWTAQPKAKVKTIAVPGAVWGVVPIVGIDGTIYDTAEKYDEIVSLVGYLIDCYVSDENGNRVLNDTSPSGYLTFRATSEIENATVTELNLIIRGLGFEALTDGKAYLGPEGIIIGKGSTPRGAHLDYMRALPYHSGFELIDADPVIDMRSVDFVTYYENFDNAGVESRVVNNVPVCSESAVLTVHQTSDDVNPALYGARVEETHNEKVMLWPIDTVAPGTIKLLSMHEEDKTPEIKSALQTFEDKRPYNYGLAKDYNTAVLYERDANLPEEDTVPVSDELIEATGGISVYNTKNLWLLFPGGMKIEQMRDLREVITFSLITGYFSREFLDKYGIPGDQISQYADLFKDSAGVQHIDSYINQVPEADRHQYVGLVVSHLTPVFTAPSQQISCWIVHRDTGLISVSLVTNYPIIGLKKGFDVITGASVEETADGYRITHNEAITKYAGYWFNTWSSSDDRLATFKDGYGNPCLIDHITQKAAAPDIDFFYQYHAPAPNKPEEYSSVPDWFEQVKLSNFIKLFNTTFAELGIHTDYRSMSLQQFLQETALRDVSKPRVITNVRKNGPMSYYIFPKDSLPSLTTGWNNHTMKSDLRAMVDGTANNFFASRPVHFYEIEAADDGHYQMGQEITDSASSSANKVWTAKGVSGHHQTVAISLTDDYNTPLPLRGTGGKIDADYITWDALLKGLNNNQRIDLLSGLKDARQTVVGGGKGYVTLRTADGEEIRLYISRTAPEGDIPVGSLGIGW